MAINLSNLFSSFINQNNTNNSANASKSDASADISMTRNLNVAKTMIDNTMQTNTNSLNLLKSMLVGDTFTGLVTNVDAKAVEILLNSNTKLEANISKDVNITKGQNLTFIVEDKNDSKITIRPLDSTAQENTVINKALEAAKLPINEKNMAIVRELLKLNMPINAKTITNLAKQAARFPNANLNSLANLNRLNIPVNNDNIGQFEAYKQFDAKMEKNLGDFESDLFKDLESLINSKENQTSPKTGANPTTINDLDLKTSLDLSENKVNIGLNASREIFKTIVDNLYRDYDNKGELKSLGEVLNSKSLEDLSKLIDEKGFKAEIKSGDIKLKDFFTKLVNNTDFFNKDNFKEVINSRDFKSLFHELINETMKLSPRDVSESESAINNFYNRLKKNVEEISKDLKQLNISPESQKSIENIRHNIDFMNELNKNLMYFQMPINFTASEGNGELYVFTDKKKLKYDPDNITAMLHLDMDNLGPIDVFVRLTKKTNLSTNFILESDEMLDFIYANIYKLEKRLADLGYETHFDMNVKDESNAGFDFVRDFIEKDVNPNALSQYILDIKA